MRDDDGRDDNDRDGNDPTGKLPADTDNSEREKQRRHLRKEKKLESLSVKVGPDLLERLEHEVDRRETTKSALVCKVVADFLVGLDYPDDEDDA